MNSRRSRRTTRGPNTEAAAREPSAQATGTPYREDGGGGGLFAAVVFRLRGDVCLLMSASRRPVSFVLSTSHLSTTTTPAVHRQTPPPHRPNRIQYLL